MTASFVRALTCLALASAPMALPYAQESPSEARPQGWFQRITYGVGVSSQLGGGSDGTTFGRHVVAEPLAFQLRSFLTPRFAFHTTLNLGRMIAPAISDQDGRIDYDCHLAAHLPVSPDHTLVVAPGAALAYSLSGSRYQRFVGDVRLGVDFGRDRWTFGLYVRPHVGWWREVGAAEGEVVGGASLEVAHIYRVPKKGDRLRK